MGADSFPESPSESLAVVIAIQNPGEDIDGRAPPPMLAVPVPSDRERSETALGLAAQIPEEPSILHVRCSGCSLIVQFPLVPDVRRHGIICSVCTRVSFPFVDEHLAFASGGMGGGAADVGTWTRGQPQRQLGQVNELHAFREPGDLADPTAAQRLGGVTILERAAAAPLDVRVTPQPRRFLWVPGGAALRGLPGRRAQEHPMAGSTMTLSALARATKWFATIDVFIVVVDALMGTASQLFEPYAYLVLLALIMPVTGYVGAFRFDLRMIFPYFAFTLLLIGYTSFTTYSDPTIWKLLLLLLEVYMSRVVLRFVLLLRRLEPAQKEQVMRELRANGRASLMPW